jgi:putative FmdB family regulatory protein
MPIYEYKCKKCGEKFDIRLGIFHSSKSVKCPKCGADEPERVFSPIASTNTSCSSRGPYS